MTDAARRTRRAFWAGLAIPAVACAAVALIAGPESWLGWAAVLAEAPAAAAGVALAWMIADRKTS